MNFQDILRVDIARYEEGSHQPPLLSQNDQSVKTNVEFRRDKLIGSIFASYFPEAKYFQPQLNKAANEAEFKLFSSFLKKIAKYKPVQDAWKRTIEVKRSALKSITLEEEQGGDL